jgi:hypothetical protein
MLRYSGAIFFTNNLLKGDWLFSFLIQLIHCYGPENENAITTTVESVVLL